MDVNNSDLKAAGVAAAIGEPARARMLYSLMDGRARTSTELSVLADVSPSTASIHLKKLAEHRLVKMVAQGKHRYFTLESANVAKVLEGLNVLGGGPKKFTPSTPDGLRVARTCYDHIAGTLGVELHDRLHALQWIAGAEEYSLTDAGARALAKLGVNAQAANSQRRRFAYPCLDWSERRPHLAGSLAAAILDVALRRKWVHRQADNRALRVSRLGISEFRRYFGLQSAAGPQHI
jgi:DNA-binding transcriptional ArsR family regulator